MDPNHRVGSISIVQLAQNMKEYRKRVEEIQSQHPEYVIPRGPIPTDPTLDVYIWIGTIDRKRKNEKFYGVGSLAANYTTRNRSLFTRIEDGEGLSRPPILTPEMEETIRQLAQGETSRETTAREAATQEVVTCETAQKA
ncbi:hypothetical protein KIW84_054377 [Lathyrus oleraceus]|uniref:Uncharacterized protein n=1 Tax=Pisum sativum TaxID=3888 RepID=A0A9D4WV58_PEA|nr:hypothetical protein KIW84_054377 [Pisum sativum]